MSNRGEINVMVEVRIITGCSFQKGSPWGLLGVSVLPIGTGGVYLTVHMCRHSVEAVKLGICVC